MVFAEQQVSPPHGPSAGRRGDAGERNWPSSSPCTGQRARGHRHRGRGARRGPDRRHGRGTRGRCCLTTRGQCRRHALLLAEVSGEGLAAAAGCVRSSVTGWCLLGQVQSRICRTMTVTACLISAKSPVAMVTSALATAMSARADPVRHQGQERGQRRFRTPHFLQIAMLRFSSIFAFLINCRLAGWLAQVTCGGRSGGRGIPSADGAVSRVWVMAAGGERSLSADGLVPSGGHGADGDS